MVELFYMGGTLFMSILTIIFVAMIVVAVLNGIPVIRGEIESAEGRAKIAYIKSVGLFALVIGILGQLIGLTDAFRAIEAAGDVAPSLVYGGLKISMITTLYGFMIYIISYLIWFGLSWKLK
ncbi:MAG: MotA/TolQ/ExbB proton channel family protein [Cyclobacteriaceae bacterium]